MRELKERLESLAEEGEPRGAVEVMRRARHPVDDIGGRTRRRRVLAPLVAAAAAAALVAGTVVLLQRPGDEGPSVVAKGGDDPPPGPPGPDGDPTLFLVPTSVPEGFDLIRATGGDQPGFSEMSTGSTMWDRSQHYVRFDDARTRSLESFDILWGRGAAAPDAGLPPTDTEPAVEDPLEPYRRDGVPVTVHGRRGYYSPRNTGSLAWEEPEGQVVLIAGRFHPDRPKEFLVRIAQALESRDDGGFDLTEAPDGFEFVGETPGVASDGTNPRAVIYQGSDGRGFQLHLVDDSDVPPSVSISLPRSRLVKVRSQDAVLTPMLTSAPGSFNQQTLFMVGADLFLQWLEPGNVRVTISGVGLDETEMLDIAETLEPVDAQTWFGLQAETQTPDPRLTPPSQLRVLVVNAGAMPGSASSMTNSLRAAGYNLLPAAETPLLRTGWAVQCRPPLEGAASALASAVSSTTGRVADVEGFDDVAAAEFADADCIVYLGE